MMQPSDWSLKRLRDVTEKSATWNPRSESRTRIRYIDVSAVARDELRITSVEKFSAEEAPSRARKIVKAGDTIFATVRPTLRRIAQVPTEFDDEIVSTAFCVLRPNRSQVAPDFLFFAVQTEEIVDAISAAETGASYPAVRDTDILEQAIFVPPLREQQQIAEALNLARAACLNELAAEQQASQLKREAIRALFARGLRGEPQKDTLFGRVPASWSVTELNACAVIQTGVAKGRKLADSDAIQVPYLRVANVQDGHLDLTEVKEITIRKAEVSRYRLQNGDVVLTEGGDFDKLGRGFIWRGQINLCVHQNHVFAVRTARDELLPEFFAYQAQSDYGKAYFLKVAHKTTNLACINSTKLKAFPVLVPSIDEQRAIVPILDAIDRKIDLHRRKRAVLDELFKTLLHKLMTAEIRVADLDLTALEYVQHTPNEAGA